MTYLKNAAVKRFEMRCVYWMGRSL